MTFLRPSVGDDKMKLRRLTVEEMDQAAVVHVTAFDERLPWLANRHTLDGARGYFRQHVFPANTVWGAFAADTLVGFIAFHDEWIEQLYVLPQRQGQGIGAALLALAKAEFPRLHLWTFQRNLAARRFYTARGFIVVRETDGADNYEKEPDVLYRWEATSSG